MSVQVLGYRIGQRVTVRVEKVLPFGVFVCLPDGHRAYIRKRELTLEGDIEPGQRFRPGQELQAVVMDLPEGEGRLPELSVRRTHPDPWPEFARQWAEGKIIRGAVRDLVPEGAFVRVAPGVDGFVSLEEIAPWEVRRPEEVLWVGDDVEAVITRLDGKNRRLRLSIRERMRRQEQEAGIRPAVLETPEEGAALARKQEVDPLTMSPWPPEVAAAIGSILVVDDHEELRLSLVEWLRRMGCRADGAGSASEAKEKLQHQTFSLLLLDIVLPDADGLDLLRWLQGQEHRPSVAVMSMTEWIEEQFQEMVSLGVAEILTKPLDLEELYRFLSRIGRGEFPGPAHLSTSDLPGEVFSFQQLSETLSSVSPSQQLRAGLEWVLRITRAEKAVVFHLDPDSKKVSVVAQAGEIPLNGSALYFLSDSPVKDVIREEEEYVLAARVSAEPTARFEKLRALLPFESCIGVPVRAEGETRHALFLFHREAEAFNVYRLRDALAAAALLAVALEREALAQQARALGQILLIGHLAAGIGHEIYNRLSGLELSLRNLQSDCEKLGRSRAEEGDGRSVPELEQRLGEVLGAAIGMKETVELFQHLSRLDQEAVFDVNQVLRRAQGALRPLVQRYRVRIQADLVPGLPLVRGKSVALEQAFLNVMLNAVQQMSLKAYGPGLLGISTRLKEEKGMTIQVRFSDTGPGIHKRLWERIFTPGFSTRPGGTGLGLFIARALIEAMGGRILVEQSVVPLGTTFLVELPGLSRREENDGRRTDSCAAGR
ncbi:MAG: S1 RNA-binding domain-containing protein [Chloroflexia bacterium]